MKKIYSVIVIMVMVMFMFCTTGIFALESRVITPKWENISIMTNSFSFDGTDGNCTGTVTGKAGTTSITGTLTVYRQNSYGQWIYVSSTSGSTETRYLNLSVNFTAVSGTYYKSVLSVTDYIGGVGESQEKPAYATCP